jgi:hypothetical protein
MPSANPTPHPLDAAALDELARKARAAQLAESDARRYSSECPDNQWSPSHFQALLDEVRVTSCALHEAATSDVILALLAAAQRGEEDTAKVRRDEAFAVARVAHWLLNDKGYTRAQASQVLAAIATRLDADMASKALGDAARSATPTEGDDR